MNVVLRTLGLRINAQWQSAASLAKMWNDAGLDTYVMKGFVLANMYQDQVQDTHVTWIAF